MRKDRVVDPIEQSITRKFRNEIFSKFLAAIENYHLITPGDRICVCISGGKDSMLLARLFMQLEKLHRYDCKVSYLVMNPGYNEVNLDLIKENLAKLSIPAVIKETNIFEVANAQTESPCFLCAKMRRGALYRLAQDMGCNKIALGHHYDDVIETTLMNLLNAGSFQTMLPKVRATNYVGMELIRPLYYVREADIIAWKNYNDLHFIQCACRFTENVAITGVGSQRKATKELIRWLKENYNDVVEKNLFTSANNVTMDMLLGYKKDGEYHSFLDHYDDEVTSTHKPEE